MIDLNALLSETAGDVSPLNIAIQYCIYAVIIVVSVLLLILLKKRSRLPRHTDLKKKILSLRDEVNALQPTEKRIDFVKSVSRAMYKADNLVYAATMLAEKERYSEFGKAAALIESARSDLAPYKFGKADADDDSGIKAAAGALSEAAAVLDGVIERDAKIKKSRK